MNARYRTEAAAWREIARRHAERERLSVWCEHREAGLGSGIAGLDEAGAISAEMHRAMMARITTHATLWPERESGWIWDPDEWDVRVVAALFLALECEGEAKHGKVHA